jgi:glucose-6-phosphate dehydrogenase assembly protein OpcA
VRLEGPDDTDALANMVASLLLPDLPVFLFWLAPPTFDRPVFRKLCGLASRVVTDSTRYPETLDRLPALGAGDDQVVTDLAWTKITGWREVVAALFDPPAHAAMLASLKKVAIQHVAGSDAQARLLAGWLGSCTGRKPAVELNAVERKDMRAGSLIAVELQCGRERFAVERPEPGVAVTASPQMPPGRLALRVPPFDELLGEELEFLSHDHAFDDALGACTAAKPKPRRRSAGRSSG